MTTLAARPRHAIHRRHITANGEVAALGGGRYSRAGYPRATMTGPRAGAAGSSDAPGATSVEPRITPPATVGADAGAAAAGAVPAVEEGRPRRMRRGAAAALTLGALGVAGHRCLPEPRKDDDAAGHAFAHRAQQRAALERRDHVRGDDEGPARPRVPAPRDRRARLQRRRHHPHHRAHRVPGRPGRPRDPAAGRRSQASNAASTPRMRPTTCRGSRSCAAGRLACARGASGSSSLWRATPPARSSTSACRVTARSYSAGTSPARHRPRADSLAPWKAQTVWVVGCRGSRCCGAIEAARCDATSSRALS